MDDLKEVILLRDRLRQELSRLPIPKPSPQWPSLDYCLTAQELIDLEEIISEDRKVK